MLIYPSSMVQHEVMYFVFVSLFISCLATVMKALWGQGLPGACCSYPTPQQRPGCSRCWRNTFAKGMNSIYRTAQVPLAGCCVPASTVTILEAGTGFFHQHLYCQHMSV